MMKTLGGVFLALLLVSPVWAAPCATTGGSTALESAARGLAAHQWCEFDSGITKDFLDTCGDSLLQINTYADSMAWDPVRRQVHFQGSPHNGALRHIVYDEAANRWTTAPVAYTCNGATCNVGPPDNTNQPKCTAPVLHAYDNNTIDPATGDFYWGMFSTERVRKFSGGSWSDIAPPPGASTGAYKYFPERGGIVSIAGASVYFWKKSTNSWSTDGTVTWGTDYHNAIEYDPVDHLMWLLDGNDGTQHYKMDSSGTITPLKTSSSPPSALGGFGLTSGLVSVDPISGRFVYFDYSSEGWWQFDITTNTWTSFSSMGITSMPPLRPGCDGGSCAADNVEVSIPEYGVIMYLAYEDKNGNTRTYLYRHSASDPVPPTAPPPPANLRPQ